MQAIRLGNMHSATSNQAASNMQAWDDGWNDYVMARNPGNPREAHSFEPWCQPLTDDEVMRIMQGGAEQHPSLALRNFNYMMMRRMAAVEENLQSSTLASEGSKNNRECEMTRVLSRFESPHEFGQLCTYTQIAQYIYTHI